MILLTEDDFIKMFNEQIKPSYKNADITVAYRAYDIYYSTSMEEMNINRNKEEQISQATMLMQQIHLIDTQDFSSKDYTDSMRRLENQYRDIRKYTYFDNFLYEGAKDDIFKVLQQYGIPTSVLKGLRQGTPYDEIVWTTPDHMQIRIIQEVEKDPSLHISRFDIYYGSKKIYSLNEQVSEEDRITERASDLDIDYDLFTNIKEIVNEDLKKTKRGYSKTINIEKTNERTFSYSTTVFEYKYNRINKNNINYTQTIYRNAKGQFTKNPYRS